MVIRNWCHKSVNTATLLHWLLYRGTFTLILSVGSCRIVVAGLNNEVATLTKNLFNKIIYMENTLGLCRLCHYNEVALLMRWLLNEVSLYTSQSGIM